MHKTAINSDFGLFPDRILSRSILLLIGMLLISAQLVGCSPAVSVEAPPASPQLISPSDYVARFGESQAGFLIDVRTPEEFATGHIPGSINIPVNELASRLTEVPQDQPVIVYCRSGNRSATAARILVDAGFGPVYDLGGIQTWVSDGLPVE